jgi:hypothetical protein
VYKQTDCSLFASTGKGLGLVASRDLVVGDLLLCVKPLALVYGPQGDPPSLEDLAAEIQVSSKVDEEY